ncbi:hypothetical protein MLPF_2026 [Mycobacterium lepromatosis]|nr:hypothetical protein MLPF_2026 [Mycobacterium lepromatosis]
MRSQPWTTSWRFLALGPLMATPRAAVRNAFYAVFLVKVVAQDLGTAGVA